MKFLYVDESGDPGLAPTSPTQYFFLAGLVIDTADLQEFSAALHSFRQHLSAKYGLLVSDEIHASHFISNPGPLRHRIDRNSRLRILLECLDWCRRRADVQLLTVGMNKQNTSTDAVFQVVWRELLMLFEAHLSGAAGHFTPTQGLVFCDNTDGAKLASVMRALQQPAEASSPPSLHYLLGDPVLQHSHKSYLLQLADVVAYFATQLFSPNQYLRAKGAHRYFTRLAPINLLDSKQPNGIMLCQ